MTTNKQLIDEEIYRAMDSFLTESKDQNGNERTLERLNADRHLFVDKMLTIISQAISEFIDSEIERKKKMMKEYEWYNEERAGWNQAVQEDLAKLQVIKDELT